MPIPMRLAVPAALAFLLAIPSPGRAQGGGLAVSIKGGVTTSDFTGSDAGSADVRVGFVAGAGARLDSWAILTLQSEVLYVQKGTDNTRVDYVEVPIMARFALPLRILEPYVVGGPFGAFAVGCSLGGTSTGCDDIGVEGFDYGLALGAGLQLPWILGLGLELRYDWSLADVPNDDFDLDIKNSAFMLMASFEF